MNQFGLSMTGRRTTEKQRWGESDRRLTRRKIERAAHSDVEMMAVLRPQLFYQQDNFRLGKATIGFQKLTEMQFPYKTKTELWSLIQHRWLSSWAHSDRFSQSPWHGRQQQHVHVHRNEL